MNIIKGVVTASLLVLWTQSAAIGQVTGALEQLIAPMPCAGIGVILGADSPPRVMRVQGGGPAALAGLKSGDLVVEVDGRATGDLPFRDVIGALRGDAGTTVEVVVVRSGSTNRTTMSLVRATLREPEVMAEETPGTPVLVLPTNTAEALQVIARELAKINARLDALAGEPELEPRFVPQKADRKRLNMLEFPDPPSREALQRYIEEILFASEGQNSFSDSDVQVGMLARVGEENIDLLLAATSNGMGGSSYHVNCAIKRIATAKSKELILAALPTNHELSDIVLAQGWASEARETLLRYLGEGYLPESWIECVVSLRDPATYDGLLKHLVAGHNRAQTYENIEGLPGIQLEPSVIKAWARARTGHVWERMGMAGVAASYGVADALEALVRGLESREVLGNQYLLERVRTAILEATDMVGMSNADIVAWYDGAKTQLVFDPVARKFTLRK